MIAALLLSSVLQVAAASTAPPPAPTIHVLVLPANGRRAYEGTLPLTKEELAGASTIYAWTHELPILGFQPARFSNNPTDLLLQLRQQPWREQTITIARDDPPRDREVLVRYAPVEYWSHFPEELLPSVRRKTGDSFIVRTREERLRVRATAQGLGSGWRDHTVPGAPITLQLEPAIDVRFTVSSTRGEIAEASATLFLHKQEGAGEVLAQIAGDGKGHIAIPAVPRLEPLALLIGASAHAPVRISAPAIDLIDRNFVLPPAAIVSGRVRDTRNIPIIGARVTLESWLTEDVGGLSRNVVVTDESGRFEARDVLARETTIVVEKKGFAAMRDTILPEPPLLRLDDITLETAVPLRLRVVDDESKPVSGARVAVNDIPVGNTDEEGEATLDVSGREPVEISLVAPHHGKTRVSLAPPFQDPEQVTLERTGTLRARVLAGENQPVANGRLIVEYGSSYVTKQLANDGAFAMDVPHSTPIKLTVESNDTTSATTPVEPLSPGEQRDLGTIHLERGGVVRGRVITSERAPVVNARIWVVRPSAAGTVASWLAGRLAETRSDESGHFSLSGLSTGTVTIRINAEHFARHQWTTSFEQDAVDLGDVVLERGAEVVVTMSSSSSEQALARLSIAGSPLELDMLTAAVLDGTAVFRGVPRGTHAIRITRGASVVCDESITVSTQERMAIACSRPTRVAGQVWLGSTTASGGTVVWSRPTRATEGVIRNNVTELGTRRQQVYGSGAGKLEAEVGPDGRFVLGEVLPGPWSVIWSSPATGLVPPLEVIVPKAATAEMTLRFHAGSVRGIVVDGDGRPVAEARVQSDAQHLAISDDQGRFSLAGMSFRRYQVQARKGATASRSVAVEVEPGSLLPDIRLVLDSAESSATRVHVTTETGEPAAGAFVFVVTASGTRILTTDSAGNAEATISDPASPMRFAAHHRGIWTFIAATDATGAHQLRMGRTGTLRVTSRKDKEVMQLLTPEGLDLVWLLSRLGILQTMSGGAIEIGGLPPGQYTVLFAGAQRTIVLEAGKRAEIEF